MVSKAATSKLKAGLTAQCNLRLIARSDSKADPEEDLCTSFGSASVGRCRCWHCSLQSAEYCCSSLDEESELVLLVRCWMLECLLELCGGFRVASSE